MDTWGMVESLNLSKRSFMISIVVLHRGRGDVSEVDQHPQPVHLLHYLHPERASAVFQF